MCESYCAIQLVKSVYFHAFAATLSSLVRQLKWCISMRNLCMFYLPLVSLSSVRLLLPFSHRHFIHWARGSISPSPLSLSLFLSYFACHASGLCIHEHCVCVVRNFFIYLWGLFGSFSRMNVIIVALCTVMIVRRTPLVYRDICIFQYCCLCSTFRSHFLRGGVIITIYLFIKSDFHLFSFTELVFV